MVLLAAAPQVPANGNGVGNHRKAGNVAGFCIDFANLECADTVVLVVPLWPANHVQIAVHGRGKGAAARLC